MFSLFTGQKHRSLFRVLRFSLVSVSLVLALLLSLTVPEAFSASTTLSWDAPTTNTDGSPLTDLAGYKIYYGTSSGAYSQTVDVGSTTSYAVTGLLDGTYYFAVTAYDTAGNESSYSNEVSRSLATQYTLTVSKTGTGTGTVTGSGISCGSTCSNAYSSGTVVTLSASAASGSQFAGWSGGGCSGTGQCVTTMTASKSVTASFTSSSSTSYTITASAGTGGSISPSGSVSVSSGASKSFTITPSSGYQITDVKVDGASVGAVSSYTFTNVTANRTISAAFSAVCSPFSDISCDNWANSYISAIYTAGITIGCGEGKYCASDTADRGQMAVALVRALYGENFTYTQSPYFSDVPSSHPFFKYIQKLKDAGITTVSGTYYADMPVTRDQMAAFLIRAKFGESFLYTQSPYFSDVPSTNAYFKYVQKLKDAGITTVSGTYYADMPVTRDQMAAFLARTFLGMQ